MVACRVPSDAGSEVALELAETHGQAAVFEWTPEYRGIIRTGHTEAPEDHEVQADGWRAHWLPPTPSGSPHPTSLTDRHRSSRGREGPGPTTVRQPSRPPQPATVPPPGPMRPRPSTARAGAGLSTSPSATTPDEETDDMLDPIRSPADQPSAPRAVLTLCGTCRGLSGPVRELHPAYQSCGCEVASDRPAPHPWPEHPWFLCHTCVAVPRERFSKWSVAHCGKCAPHIRALNRQVGRVAVPYGWHSIINAASAGRPLEQGPDPEGLHHDLARIHAGFGTLKQWRRQRIDELCRRAGLPTDRDLPLERYTQAVATLNHTRAFPELLAFIAERSL